MFIFGLIIGAIIMFAYKEHKRKITYKNRHRVKNIKTDLDLIV